MPHTNHPSRDRLTAFTLGNLDDEELDRISDHLDACPACCDALKSVEVTDPLVENLQAVALSRSDSSSLSAASQSAVTSLFSSENHTRGAEPTIPSQIQQYRIIGEVGRGGMGVVYHAVDVTLNRHVALKMVLSGQFASPEQLIRFRQEAELVAQVRHPHIVQVYEVGEHRGQPFVAFEWVDGGSLAKRLRERLLTPKAAAELFEILALAVHAAHCQRIIHRDLKPSNILMSGDLPKIADFGLALHVDGDQRLTATGNMIGTPEYMAPEQATGKTQNLGPAIDIYALGAMMFESLSGQPPFRSESSLATLHRVLNHDAPSLISLCAHCPRDFETIVRKCLNKTPSLRYPTAKELAKDLRCFLNGEPIAARRVGRAERAWSWCRRYPAVASLLLALFVSLVGGGIVSTMFAIDAREQARKALSDSVAARQSELAARQATQAAEAARRIAQSRAYNSNCLLLQNAWEQHQIPRFLKLLELQRPAPGEMDLRNFEWYYWQQQMESGHQTIPTLNSATRVAFHPNGRRLAVGTQSGEILMVDVAERKLSELRLVQSQAISDLCFSPDGTLLATASQDHTVQVWDTATGKVSWIGKEHTSPVVAVRFQPDGSRVISSCREGSICTWDSKTGQLMSRIQNEEIVPVTFDISPDGRLAQADLNGRIKVFDLVSGQEFFRKTASPGTFERLRFSQDGTWLVAIGGDRRARVLNSTTGTQRCEVLHAMPILGGLLNADASRLLTFGNDHTLRLFDADSGTELHSFQGHLGPVTGAEFAINSPDSIVSASTDGTIRVWGDQENPNPAISRSTWIRPSQGSCSSDGAISIVPGSDKTIRLFRNTDGSELRTLSSPVSIRAVTMTPDEKSLLTANYDNTISLWNLESGTRQQTFFGHLAMVNTIAVHPDGSKFVSASDDGTLRVCELPSGQLLHELRSHTDIVYGVVFDPTGHHFASSSFDNTIKLWSTASGQELFTLNGHSHRVFGMAFDSTGRTLASASEDDTVKIWDVHTGVETMTLRGHGGPVRCVAFTPDNKRLATGGWDRNIILWDTHTGQEVASFKGHDEEVVFLTFTRDGQSLLSLSHDGTLRIWKSKSR